MEGLLGPATYDVRIDENARDVMNSMLTTFNDNVQKNKLVAMAKAHGLNEYQLVILASIVQREVLNNSDAPGVAGVYWNRAFSNVPNDTAGFVCCRPTVPDMTHYQHPPQTEAP